MRSRLHTLASFSLVLASLALPLRADAQFGDLLKQKAKKAAEDAARGKATGTPAQPAATPASAPASAQGSRATRARSDYNSYVLELTPEVTARFATALATHASVHDSLIAVADAHGPEWQRKNLECQGHLTEDAKYKTLFAAYTNESATMEARSKAGNDMMAYAVEKCGDPNTASKTRDLLGSLPGQRAIAAGGFANATQYDLALERVIAFCRSPEAASASGATKIAGQPGHFYVFSEAEVAALKPKCATFGPQLAKVT